MMKYAQIFMIALVFAGYLPCNGQEQSNLLKDSVKSETVISSQGPDRMVRTIKQDRYGNIWLASAGGMIRYDGKSFTYITDRINPARFFSVLEDRKGNFWFASVGSGVDYYDGKSLRNYTTRDGLASDRVTNIYEDGAGNIWFGTENGASRYDGKAFKNFKMNEASAVNQGDSVHQSVYLNQLPAAHWMHNDVNSIIEDKTGKFWFGTRGFTFIYDGKVYTALTRKDGKPFQNVRTIIRDKKGNIWLGGNDGLWKYDGSTFTNFSQKFVGYIYEEKQVIYGRVLKVVKTRIGYFPVMMKNHCQIKNRSLA